ncbi:MAG: ATP-binding response regulator [Rhizobiaceae bacterium]
MSYILSYLNQIIDQFVPQHMRDDIAAEKRVRMFLISHLMGPFLGHPITIFLLATDPQPFPHVHILGLSITLFWTFPILLKIWPERYSILAFLSVQNLSFAILWGSYHYGGAQSPFLMWYLVLPLLAFFYLGSGLKTSAAIFAQCTIGLLVFAGIIFVGGLAPVNIPLAEMSHISIISALCASIYVFFMASYYATVVDSQSEFLKEIARHQETLKQLTVAKEEAERANGAKSDFLAKMSHELRTPLNAVLGYSEILLEDAELDGRGEDIADLQKISAAGKHLLSMVNDILDISKIEAGKTDLYLEAIDLDALVDEIESTSRPLAAKNTNKFIVERGNDLGEIHLDATKLRQAIYNLLSNAAKFTQNGEIKLQVHRLTSELGERIQIKVADTGVGISQEAQENLFTNFTQANASINAKFGGTGLGLSLSRNLIRLMEGDILVESVEGEGTTFTIDLPTHFYMEEAPVSDDEQNGESDTELDAAIQDLKKVASAHANSQESDVEKPAKGKVIIVDDDKSFLELTERMLNKEGYSAICTDTPDAVLDLAIAAKPVAIFVDVLMPNTDGWGVISSLKAEPATAEIPVFMLSILEEREKAREYSAADFVTKPLDAAKLKKIVERIENRASDSENGRLLG